MSVNWIMCIATKAKIGGLASTLEDLQENTEEILGTWNGCMNANHQVRADLVQVRLQEILVMVGSLQTLSSFTFVCMLFPTAALAYFIKTEGIELPQCWAKIGSSSWPSKNIEDPVFSNIETVKVNQTYTSECPWCKNEMTEWENLNDGTSKCLKCQSIGTNEALMCPNVGNGCCVDAEYLFLGMNSAPKCYNAWNNKTIQ